MATKWFVKLGEQSAGPFSPAQIKQMASSGQLTPDSLICREVNNSPDGQWIQASRVKGLFASLASSASTTAGPEESTSPATPEANIDSAGRTSVSLSRTYEAQNPTNPQDVLYVILGLFCCFPIGLYLLWTRNWKTNTKVIITSAFIFFVLIVNLINSPTSSDLEADVREETWSLVRGREQRQTDVPHLSHELKASPSGFSVKEMGNNTFRVEGTYTQYVRAGYERSANEYTSFVAIVRRNKSGRWILEAFNPPESKTRDIPPPNEPDASVPLPDFEVGGLRDQDKTASTAATAAPGTIGKWRDAVIGVVSIIQESGIYYLVIHSDGSRLSLQAASSPKGRRFIRPGSASGDYYIINAQGNLESWDSQGLIDTAPRL